MAEPNQVLAKQIAGWQRDLEDHRKKQSKLEAEVVELQKRHRTASHDGVGLMLMKEEQEARQRAQMHQDAADAIEIRLRNVGTQ